jgi:hypothetical protein
MLKKSVFMLAAAFAAGAAAGQSSRPDPADPKAAVKAPPRESAFRDYRPWAEAELARWREVNEEVRRLGGHPGHVPQSAPPGGAAPRTGKPAALESDGERK